MSLSPAFLDEVRAGTSLSGLIERKVKLVRAGNEKKGCCPFHQEKSPSFYVNDDKAFYHCFGCGAHGDAIRWMTDHEGMPFLDAVRELAAAAGLEMPDRDPVHADRDRERESMIVMMEKAAAFYAAELAGDRGAAGRDYLASRGVLDAAVGLGAGWANGARGPRLIDALKDFTPEWMVKAGLAKVHPDRGEHYDFFRNRVVFPIRDQRGRVIGFGGRVLGDQQPKYLNSPDTPVFDKGRTLFNVDRAAPAARAAKRLLVVEGYMDVIGLAAAGVGEVVAPNGTALTEDQIRKLWKLEGVPILCFDGDRAGRAAAARAAVRALPLLEPGKSLSFVTPPDGQDPDDVARAGGREAVDAMLARPAALADVLWAHEKAAEPLDTPEQIAGLKARLREHVRSIRNADVREAYGQDMLARLRRAFGAASSAPRRPAGSQPAGDRKWRRPVPQTAASRAIGEDGIGSSIERAVIAGLLNFPQIAHRDAEAVSGAQFSHNAASALRDALLEATFAGDAFEVPAELAPAAAFAHAGRLRFSFTDPAADEDRALRDLVDALNRLRR